MLVDTGSDWNLLSEQDWEKLTGSAARVFDLIENTGDKALAYASATSLITSRSFHAWVEVKEATKPRAFAKFRVILNYKRSILG